MALDNFNPEANQKLLDFLNGAQAVADLMALKAAGIAKTLATNILALRARIGKFEKVEQLLEVKAITKAQYEKIVAAFPAAPIPAPIPTKDPNVWELPIPDPKAFPPIYQQAPAPVPKEPENVLPPVEATEVVETEAFQIKELPLADVLKVSKMSPKIADRLKESGILTTGDLARANGAKVKEMLADFPKDTYQILQAHAALNVVSADLQLNTQLLAVGISGLRRLATASDEEMKKAAGGEKLLPQMLNIRENARLLGNLPAGIMADPIRNAPGQFVLDIPHGPSCGCDDCHSALSPTAYLGDLMQYAVEHVYNKYTRIDTAFLARTLYQPVDEIGTDCHVAKDPLCHKRLVAEVLRAYFAAHPIPPQQVTPGLQFQLTTRYQNYLEAAYRRILLGLGVGYEELRDNAFLQPDALERLAQRLGVPANKINDLLLDISDSGSLTEARLETIFGLRDTNRAPLSTPNRPQYLDWHYQTLREEWLQQDGLRDAFALRQTPFLDPDIVSLEDLRSHQPQNAVFALWNTRRAQVDNLLRQYNGATYRPNTYLDVDALFNGVTLNAAYPSDASSRLAALQNSYRNFVNANGAPLTLAEEHEAVCLRVLNDKLGFATAWLTDEQNLNFGPESFIPALREPVPSTLRLMALLQGTPQVDPDLVRYEDLYERFLENAAQTLWNQRRQDLLAVPANLGNNHLVHAAQNTANLPNALNGLWLDVYAGATAGNPRHFLSIETELSSLDPLRIAAATTLLEGMHLTVAEFDRIMACYHSNSSWSDVYLVLSRPFKINILYPIWLSQEGSPNYRLLRQNLVPWLATAGARATWTQALRNRQKTPVIVPYLVNYSNLSSLDNSNRAYMLLNARFTQVNTLYTTYRGQLNQGGLAAILSNFGLNVTDLDVLKSLRDDDRRNIVPRLRQYGIAGGDFDVLLNYKTREQAGRPILVSEKDELLALAVRRAVSVEHYGLWNAQETQHGITNSPDWFVLRELEVSEIARERSVLERRLAPVRERRSWERLLQARERQWETGQERLRQIIEDTEEATLRLLVDLLSEVCIPDNSSLESKQEKLTDLLLIDVKNDCCGRVTRVSQLIESLQNLLNSLHLGILRDTYPDLRLTGSSFQAEWNWLGSYATWRSAMFVWMYPENYLSPTLRRHPTYGFRNVLDSLRNSGARVTPTLAVQAIRQYQSYLLDVRDLAPAASVTHEYSVGKMRTWSFAQSTKGKCYWSLLDDADAAGYGLSSWAAIPGLEDQVVTQILGATIVIGGGLTICLFLKTKDKANEKLLLLRHFTASGEWDSTPIELEVPENAKSFRAVVGQMDTPWLPALLAIQVESGAVYFCKLDNEGKEWAAKKRIFNKSIGLGKILKAVISCNDYPGNLVVTDQDFGLNLVFLEESPLANPDKIYYYLMGAGQTYCRHLLDWWPQQRLSLDNVLQVRGSAQAYLFFTRFGNKQYKSLTLGNFRPYNFANFNDFNEYMKHHLGVHTMGIPFPIENPAQRGAINSQFGYVPSDLYGILNGIFGHFRTMVDLAAQTNRPLPPNLRAQMENGNITTPLGWPGFTIAISLAKQFIDAYKFSDNEETQSEWEPYREVMNWGNFVRLCFLDNLSVGYWEANLGNAVGTNYNNFAPSVSIAGNSMKRRVLMREGEQVKRFDFMATGGNQLTYTTPQAMTPDFGGPLLMSSLVTASPLYNATRKNNIASIWNANSGASESVKEYLREALYFLPMQAALSLQKEAYYKDALYWFSTVYDYSLPVSGRKIWTELVEEETRPVNMTRSGEWQRDPLNPHAIAATRRNAYTIYTLRCVAQCFVEFADSEYTLDSSESVPRARELYRTASELLRLLQTRTPCDQLIDGVNTPGGDGYFVEEWRHIVADGLGKLEYLRYRQGAVEALNQIAANNNATPQQKLEAARDVLRQFLLSQGNPQRLPLINLVQNQQWYLNELLNGGIYNNANNLPAPSGNAIYTPWLFEPKPGYCLPYNPILRTLLLRSELQLFKIRHCMNIAGVVRELDAYAAATDSSTGMPYIGAGGNLTLPGSVNALPTQYRFTYLIERAKNLTALAQQIEGAYLSALEKRDSEAYALMQAKQHLQVARSGLKLQEMRVKEAEGGVKLAELQKDKTEFVADTYREWVEEGWNEYEEQIHQMHRDKLISQLAIIAYQTKVKISEAISEQAKETVTYFGVTVASRTAEIIGALAKGLAEMSKAKGEFKMEQLQALSGKYMREREWKFAGKQAEFDTRIADQQIRLAEMHVQISGQERAIAEMETDHAQATVEFLQNKFTNQELYEWMSEVLGRVYGWFLRTATATAQQAATQLAFERQEEVPPLVQADYWDAPQNGLSLSGEGGSAVDRRGLTGSSRLLLDLYRLDQFAADTNRRKLQITKTISLAQLNPLAFAQFRATGKLAFSLPSEMFDRDFPGQYLRLIRQVRVSVAALVPPTDGIKATLTGGGLSRVVVRGDTFQERVIRREPEMIAFTGARDASGLFDLQPSGEFLFPFEGSGVVTSFEFGLDPQANTFDFGNIADVILSIDYTALYSEQYAVQVRALLAANGGVEASRMFSLKSDFPDQWYDLHNPAQTATPGLVSFSTLASDFPSNLQNILLQTVRMYCVTGNGSILPVSIELGLNNGQAVSASPDGATNTAMWTAFAGQDVAANWSLSFTCPTAAGSSFAGLGLRDLLMIVEYSG